MSSFGFLGNSREGRRSLMAFGVSYFFVLFNYPLVRASSTALFFEAFGARSSPGAWLWAIVVLSVAVYGCNRLQKTQSAQRIFFFASLASALLFATSGVLETRELSYAAFVWKEAYVVIQVHLLLAYANNYFSPTQFKLVVGPVGAIGSFGGICGGLATSYLSGSGGATLVLLCGAVAILVPVFSFFLTPSLISPQEKGGQSPFMALDRPILKSYVLCIAIMVALTQFIINIMDFKFNLAFEASIPGTTERTSFLGNIYTATNLVTFFLQVLVLPWILPRVNERQLHFFIPVTYLALALMILLSPWGGIWPIAVTYVYMKASDYSLFSAAKELLYLPLRPLQKYGAKYLTDMITYRMAKALIAGVLLYVQSSLMLNILMGIFLICWLGTVILIFRYRRKLFAKESL